MADVVFKSNSTVPTFGANSFGRPDEQMISSPFLNDLVRADDDAEAGRSQVG